jgi:RNA polymerase sigma-70 factor, ECF subfamily
MRARQDRYAGSAFPFSGAPGEIVGVPTEAHTAFTTALTRHRPELEGHCARLLGSRADAEDALQETWLRAWRSRHTATAGPTRAWLYRIATNACFDLMARRDVAVAPLDEHGHPATPPEERPEAMVISRETVELALLTALQHLPPRQHASFVMRDVLSWSAAQSATALDTSVAATNSSLQRARRELRERLAPDRLEWACAAPSARQRRAVSRYVSAVS